MANPIIELKKRIHYLQNDYVICELQARRIQLYGGSDLNEYYRLKLEADRYKNSYQELQKQLSQEFRVSHERTRS